MFLKIKIPPISPGLMYRRSFHDLSLQCDGMSLDLANGPRLEGIALLNIPSIYGGTNLWGENPSQKKRRKAQKAKKDKDKEFSTSSMSSAELAIAVQGKVISVV